jgi:flagellar basal body rod protein FlgC
MAFARLPEGFSVVRRRRASKVAIGHSMWSSVMGIFNAMQTAVSGMQVQGYSLDNISANIANSQTIGYKRIETNFRDLIPNMNSMMQHPQQRPIRLAVRSDQRAIRPISQFQAMVILSFQPNRATRTV